MLRRELKLILGPLSTNAVPPYCTGGQLIILPHCLMSIHIIELKAPDLPLSSPHNGGSLLISLLSGHHHLPAIYYSLARPFFTFDPAATCCRRTLSEAHQPLPTVFRRKLGFLSLACVFCPSPVLPGMLPSLMASPQMLESPWRPSLTNSCFPPARCCHLPYRLFCSQNELSAW